MDGAIDYIYYTATSTNLSTGDTMLIEAQYFVPFFDFLLVFLVFCFTILCTIVYYKVAYTNDNDINIKNYIKVKDNF